LRRRTAIAALSLGRVLPHFRPQSPTRFTGGAPCGAADHPMSLDLQARSIMTPSTN
jgi:hypothetical protein